MIDHDEIMKQINAKLKQLRKAKEMNPMKEFTPGKSLFRVEKTFQSPNRHNMYYTRYIKGQVLRFSSLNDLRNDICWFLLRNDETGQLEDMPISNLKEYMVPM